MDETNPLSVFLVTSGSKGDRLLFRFPYDLQANKENCAKDIKKSPYALLNDNKEDLGIPKEDSLACNESSLLSFGDKLLSTLFAVKPELCGQKLELKIENVRFIGHPTYLPHDSNREQSTITMFNVVFALRADASHSIVDCYHDLTHRLAIAIRNEERRCNYLTSQVKLMQNAHDEISSLPEDNEESPFELILSRSELAVQLKISYEDLKKTGVVRLKINGWIELSFCLPHKVYRLQDKGLLVDPECIQECLLNLRPYHGLLLLTGAAELLSALPEDSSPALIRLISVTSPLKNFQQLAADADIILTHVFQLVSHLLYWGKATIIYPLCDSNTYVISPHAPTNLNSPLVPKFSEQFPNSSLLAFLSQFSLPISLSALHNPMNSPYQQAQQVQMVIWMLQHRLLTQLHTYVYIMKQESEDQSAQTLKTDELSELSSSYQSEDSPVHSKSSSLSLSDEEEISLREQDYNRVNNLKPSEITFLRSMSNSKDDWKNFSRKMFINHNPPICFDQESTLTKNVYQKLCHYFNGLHHLEEIMYCENLRRSHLHSLLDKFRHVLITCQYEDRAVYALNRRSSR